MHIDAYALDLILQDAEVDFGIEGEGRIMKRPVSL